jgi:hypothetical protein
LRAQPDETSKQLIYLVLAVLLVHVFFIAVLLPIILEKVAIPYTVGFVDDYDLIARNLAEGNGFRFFPETALTIVREPGYPIVLATVFALFGYSITAAQLLNCFLAAAVAGITATIARQLTSDRLAVHGALLIYLFHPATLVAISRGGFVILFELALVTCVL